MRTDGVGDREAHLVELVDDAGEAIGVTTVEAAHRAPGQLHRAFSVHLTDPAGRLLLQRRAASKTRFAGRWANACCGHPAPGRAVTDAAVVRVGEELGLALVSLTDLGVYRYRAADDASGLVEWEYDHVLHAAVPGDPRFEPDPTEVAELRWVSPASVAEELAAKPSAFAPWLAGTLDVLLGARLPGV
jgi:isopentenyl-diphosphate Delta-isomerase